jgi:NACHT domain
MLNIQKHTNEITELIALWITKIYLSDAQYYYDINKISEGLAMHLLNLIYKYKLKDLNELKSNHPGIDLGDSEEAGIAFQITSRTDSSKIKESLRLFHEKNLIKQFPAGVRFLILTNRKQATVRAIPEYPGFFPDRDVLYPADLIAEIMKIYRSAPNRYQEIKGFLEREFSIGYGRELGQPDFTSVSAIYLQWLAHIHANIEVRGIRNQSRISVPIGQVFIALKGDRTHPYERIQKGLAMENELNKVISTGEFRQEQRDAALWYLVAGSAPNTAPIDIFSTNVYQTALLTIGEAYQQNDKLIILGDPGSGKTTLASWLVYTMAKAMLAEKTLLEVPYHQIDPEAEASDDIFLLGKVKLPVLVRISEYAEDRLNKRAKKEDVRSLFEFLGHHSWLGTKPGFNEYATPDILHKYIVSQIKNNNALIVLDGLDEIPSSNLRDEVLKEIDQFIVNYIDRDAALETDLIDNPTVVVNRNKLLVTSRIVGYYAAHLKVDITHLTIEPMRDHAVDRFCEAWMSAVHDREFQSIPISEREQQAAQYAAALKAEIHDPRRIKIRALASNPLLCGFIATAFYNGKGHLPQQRVKLYETVVTNMIELWSLRMEKVFNKRFNEFEILSVLEPLAYFIHENIPTGLLPENKLSDLAIFQLALARKEDPENPSVETQKTIAEFIRILREDVGLLAARGNGVYGFLHLTFQEYFAARHLTRERKKVANEIMSKLENPRWQEPIRMSLGYININKPVMFREVVSELLKTDQKAKSLLPRNAVLVAGALQEINEISEDVIALIIDILISAYAGWDTEGRSTYFKTIVQQALHAISIRGFEYLIEEHFVAKLSDPDVNGKYVPAIATLIDETERYSTDILQALITALPADQESWQWPVHAALRKGVTPPDPEPPQAVYKPVKDSRMFFYQQQLEQNQNAEDRGKIQQLILKLETQHEQDLEAYEVKKKKHQELHKVYVAAEMPLRCPFPIEALPFRFALEHSPDLVNLIINNGTWLRICTSLFGGLEDYRCTEYMNEFTRISAYLQLNDNERKAFEVLFRDKWHLLDPIYHMAVHLDQYWPRLKAHAKKRPVFRPEAIYKDSQLSGMILSALKNGKTPESLLNELYAILFNENNLNKSADTVVCLLAMGIPIHDIMKAVALREDQQMLMNMVRDKLSQLFYGLNDPVARASEHIKDGLAEVAKNAQSELWKEVLKSTLSVIVHRQILQFNMLDLLIIAPLDQGDYIYAEHLAQKVLGSSDDAIYVAAVAADLYQTLSVSTELVVNCIKLVASTVSITMPVYQYGWPVEKFPPFQLPDNDIPIAVLNNFSRIHSEIAFLREAIFTRLRPVISKNAELLPEVMLVNLMASGENGTRASTLLSLYPQLNDWDILAVIKTLGESISTPFYKARFSLRLAEVLHDKSVERISSIREMLGKIIDPHERVQVLEWLMRVDDLAHLEGDTKILLQEIFKIEHHLNQAAAYLRILNSLPEKLARQAIPPFLDALQNLPTDEMKSEIISMAFPLLQNDPDSCRILIKLAEGLHMPWCRYTALRQHGATLAHTMSVTQLSPQQNEIWNPIILSALLQDANLSPLMNDKVFALWQKVLNDKSSLTELIAYGRIHGLKLTVPAAKCIDQLIEMLDPKQVANLLELMEHPEPDTLLIVRTWSTHQNKDINAYAALLLCEIQGLSFNYFPQLLSLLDSKIDLSRHRVSRLLRHPTITPKEPTRLLLERNFMYT